MALTSLQSAASGLTALSGRLDVLANNLANVNTDGFKASRVNFQDLLYQEKAQPGVVNANGDQRPHGLYVGLGVTTSGTQLDFRQGSPVATGQAYDMAIEGRGFFRVAVDPDRAPGGFAYTRAGNFTTNADGELVLANTDGPRLDPPIQIPQDATAFSVTSTGEVSVSLPNQAEQTIIGQIELAGFINPTGLSQLGTNLFAETGASGPPIQANAGEGGLGRIRHKHLETSNVNPTNELIELIRTQRAFEMNSQSIKAADDVLQTVAQLRR